MEGRPNQAVEAYLEAGDDGLPSVVSILLAQGDLGLALATLEEKLMARREVGNARRHLRHLHKLESPNPDWGSLKFSGTERAGENPVMTAAEIVLTAACGMWTEGAKSVEIPSPMRHEGYKGNQDYSLQPYHPITLTLTLNPGMKGLDEEDKPVMVRNKNGGVQVPVPSPFATAVFINKQLKRKTVDEEVKLRGGGSVPASPEQKADVTDRLLELLLAAKMYPLAIGFCRQHGFLDSELRLTALLRLSGRKKTCQLPSSQEVSYRKKKN